MVCENFHAFITINNQKIIMHFIHPLCLKSEKNVYLNSINIKIIM
jgi:hypothetical protein